MWKKETAGQQKYAKWKLQRLIEENKKKDLTDNGGERMQEDQIRHCVIRRKNGRQKYEKWKAHRLTEENKNKGLEQRGFQSVVRASLGGVSCYLRVRKEIIT